MHLQAQKSEGKYKKKKDLDLLFLDHYNDFEDLSQHFGVLGIGNAIYEH